MKWDEPVLKADMQTDLTVPERSAAHSASAAQSPAAQSPTAQSFVFEGRLNGASFADFARHRAARLNLSLDIETRTDHAVQLSVGGEPSLIDMFEMAMSLGPHDCIVLDITRLEEKAA
jgi:acylphosphatase